ncbi:hypothetical protein Tco_0680363 [Tanacetum coccineum]|uniref:Uncharacterized protein n=1 Tax=Tanacetum coccineum TaxID=301880 RepID=A0ABQ4XKB0_9ASTR
MSATTVTEKGILLGNVDLEGIKGEDLMEKMLLMVTMAGAMQPTTGIFITGTGWLGCSSDSEIIQWIKLSLRIGNSDDEEEEYDKPSVSIASLSVSTARPSVSTARPVSIARPSVSTTRPVSTTMHVYATRPFYLKMDNVRPKLAFRPKDLKQDVKTFGVQNMTTVGSRAIVNTGKGKLKVSDLKKSRWVWRPKGNYLDHVFLKELASFMQSPRRLRAIQISCFRIIAVLDSGCSSHIDCNKAYLNLKTLKISMEAFVAFGKDELNFKLPLIESSSSCLGSLDMDDVYNMDLKNIVPSGGYNLFICIMQLQMSS